MDSSQLWYCPHRPDFLVLTPCDTEEVPCSATMVVSLDHMHQPEGPDKKWRHPKSTAWVTCFGDVGKQQPRIVRCTCGQSPCQMRSRPHNELDDLIPKDWATNYVTPATLPPATEQRRESAIRMWLDCTGKADHELPRPEGAEQPQEQDVTAAAEVMLTDYLKGRVCFNCNLPSTKMSKCGSCSQARYCSRECQRAHWGTHKVACKALAAATAAAPAAGAAAGDAAGGRVANV